MHWKPNNWNPHSSESPITKKQTKNVQFWPPLPTLHNTTWFIKQVLADGMKQN